MNMTTCCSRFVQQPAAQLATAGGTLSVAQSPPQLCKSPCTIGSRSTSGRATGARNAYYRPPMPSLRSTLDDLAHSFASAVLDAIRSASLDELVGDGAPRRPARARGVRAPARAPSPATFDGGRLARRSSEDIQRTLGLIVAALKAGPMRAEQIQKSLALHRKELPRVLKLGLSTRALKKRGAKRATMYSVA